MKGSMDSEFQKVARTFSRQWGVQVILSGTACCATDKAIYIPANSDQMKKADKQVLHGLLDHEWKHVEEETIAAEKQAAGIDWPSPRALMVKCESNKERYLLNVYEDIRIEADASRRYAGVADNIRRANQFTINNLRASAAKGTLATGKKWMMLGTGILTRAMGEDDSYLPAETRALLDGIGDLIARAKVSVHAGDCFQLMRETLERVRIAAEPSAPSLPAPSLPAPGEGGEPSTEPTMSDPDADAATDADGDEDNEDGTGKGKAGDEDSDEDADEGTSDADASKGEGDIEPATDATKTNPTGSDDTSPDAGAAQDLLDEDDAEVPTDPLDDVRDHMEEAAKAEMTASRKHYAAPSVEALDHFSTVESGSESDYTAISDGVRAQVAALRSKISLALRSRKAVRYQGDQERGSVDSAALYGLRMNERRIFAQRQAQSELNTAIQVVVDLSGSMGSTHHKWSKSLTARAVAVALSETLDALGIPFEVVGFDNDGYSRGTPEEKVLYNRWQPLTIHVFKGFGEQYRKTHTRLVNIEGNGDNSDGDALKMIAPRLAARPEARKMMIVLSDGMPSCSASDDHKLNADLKETVKRIIRAGIEVFGIGIQTEAVSHFYPDFTVVNDLDKLAEVIFKMLKTFLLKKVA